MNAFTFWNPTKIIFGKNQIAGITQEIPASARVLLTYGGGSIKKNGVYEQVLSALKGYSVFEFAGIEPNPTYETLMKAVHLVHQERISFILAVGGGSVLDGSKFIAAASLYPRELDSWNILTGGPAPRAALPLGTILTLPATGSEMNSGAVITRQSTKDKLFFQSPYTFPKFSVLDPTVTFSLPDHQVANGIADAFVHVLEQYLTFPVNAEVQDRFAESLLQTLLQVGPQTLAHPTDYDSRANFMWAATLALNGLIGAGVPQDWTTHMIGHELTVLHGMDHGRTLAVLMPATLRVMRRQKQDKLLQYAERVWGLHTGTTEDKITEAIAKTENFFQQLQIKTRLHQYNIALTDIEPILQSLERHHMVALGERGQVNLEVSKQILLAAEPG